MRKNQNLHFSGYSNKGRFCNTIASVPLNVSLISVLQNLIWCGRREVKDNLVPKIMK